MASTPSSGSCRACEEGKPSWWEGSLGAASAHFWVLQVSREAGGELSPAGSAGLKGAPHSSVDKQPDSYLGQEVCESLILDQYSKDQSSPSNQDNPLLLEASSIHPQERRPGHS